MTSIAFHFNAPSKLAYACRLLRKAASSGSAVAVWAEEPLLTKLDDQLWSFSALDFVPHGRAHQLTALQSEHTPILLCESAEQGVDRPILVNLTHTVPNDVARFDRVIEVVTQDEQDKQSARQRWKKYTELGYEIVRHDLNLSS